MTSPTSLTRLPSSSTAMKLFAALFLFLFAAPAFAQASVAEPELRAELAQRYAAEQDVRMRLIAKGAFSPDSLANPSPEVMALMTEMMTTDANNLAFVETLVAEHGWPTPALIGTDGVDAVFMVIQHSDPATQERMLPLVEAAYRAGNLPGQSYALLLDRVLVISRGEPQVYGTQAAFGPDGEMVLSPTIDDTTLDARRAEVGLPPIAEYFDMMRQMYQAAPASE